MIGWCIANRQPRIAMDVGEEAIRFNNPYLPLTRSEIALPILSHGEILGAITIQSTEPRAFDQNDILVLQGITDCLAIAIENGRLSTELHQNLDEINTLNRNYLQGAWAEVVTQLGPVSATYDSGKNPDGDQSVKMVNIPILLRDQMIGQVALETENGQLSDEDAALLDAISTQTALALENARLVQESERKVYQEQKLNDLTAKFARANDIESILRTAAEQLGQLPSVAEVTVQLVTPEGSGFLATEGSNGGNGKEKQA
jgi:GAF domain-containing protein